jgi:hypothetical protein
MDTVVSFMMNECKPLSESGWNKDHRAEEQGQIWRGDLATFVATSQNVPSSVARELDDISATSAAPTGFRRGIARADRFILSQLPFPRHYCRI